MPQKAKNVISLIPELGSRIVPANIYLFKVNNRNTGKSLKYVNDVDVILVSLLLNLNIFGTFFRFSIANFEQVNFC